MASSHLSAEMVDCAAVTDFEPEESRVPGGSIV
jgi:hypothetical protein